MALDLNNKKYITSDHVTELVKALNSKNKEQTALIYSDINRNKAAIEAEIQRAYAAEQTLNASILNEEQRSNEVEASLDNRLSAIEIDYLKATDKTELNNKIAAETRDRISALDNQALLYDKKLSELDNSINNIDTGTIANKVREVEGKLQDNINRQTEELQAGLSEEIRIREELSSNFIQANTAVNQTIASNFTYLDNKISEHVNAYDSTKQTIALHIANNSNPHNVTPNQIGAATQEALQSVDDRLTITESKLQNVADGDIANLKDAANQIAVNKDNIDLLRDVKLDKAGHPRISGALTIAKSNDALLGDTDGDLNVSGDIFVAGNLTVQGTTITQGHEAILIKDNFLTVNSDGNKLGTSQAGLTIRTDSENAYGIIYDPNNDSVSLGKGIVNKNNQFSFADGESKPILTRAESDKLSDKHLLIWDAEKNIAVDGGPYDPTIFDVKYATWESHNSLAAEIHALDNTNIEKGELGRVTKAEKLLDEHSQALDDLTQVDINYSEHFTVVDDRLSNLEDTRQTKTDSDLETSDTTIVGAINEVHKDLNIHILDQSNPHGVTWKQIIDQGNTLSKDTMLPLMDGEAKIGQSEYVARYDHVHPVDTSRAPVNHASASEIYGVGTDSQYGHVRVDSTVSTTSVNPVQNKVITDYINTKINALDLTKIELTQNQTIKSIEQVDGKLFVELQEIAVNEDDFENLNNALTKLNQDLLDSNNIRAEKDAELQAAISTLDEKLIDEINTSRAAETSLSNDIIDERAVRGAAIEALNTSFNNQISQINLNLNEAVTNISELRSEINNLDKTSALEDSLEDIIKQLPSSSNVSYVLNFDKVITDNTETWIPKFTQLDLELDDGILG